MANSTYFNFVPLIGLENFVYYDDGGTNKPGILDISHTGYVALLTTGDGNTPSAAESTPAGRPGSLKTFIQLIATAETNNELDSHIHLVLNVPPGMSGGAPSRFTAAQLADDANWPVWDPSELAPVLSVLPTYSFFGAASEGTFSASSQECWPFGVSMTLGLIQYVPPAQYSTYSGLIGAVESTLGQYGVIIADLCITNQDAGEGDPANPISAGMALQVGIDFSWTAGN